MSWSPTTVVKSALNRILLNDAVPLAAVHLLADEENISFNRCPDYAFSCGHIVHTDVVDKQCLKAEERGISAGG